MRQEGGRTQSLFYEATWEQFITQSLTELAAPTPRYPSPSASPPRKHVHVYMLVCGTSPISLSYLPVSSSRDKATITTQPVCGCMKPGPRERCSIPREWRQISSFGHYPVLDTPTPCCNQGLTAVTTPRLMNDYCLQEEARWAF